MCSAIREDGKTGLIPPDWRGRRSSPVRQCDAENNCSAFSDFKRVIQFSLQASKLNRVTGTYDITWASPFSGSVLLENGNPVANPAASGSASFRDRESGTYTYTLSTLDSTFQVMVTRFDPSINTEHSLTVYDQTTLNAADISLTDIFIRLTEQIFAEHPAEINPMASLFHMPNGREFSPTIQ